MNSPEPSDSSEATLNQIKEALYKGHKIVAIKIYRTSTGKGLAESKEHIERLEQELRAREPERFQSAASGCMSVIVIVAVAVLVLLFIRHNSTFKTFNAFFGSETRMISKPFCAFGLVAE